MLPDLTAIDLSEEHLAEARRFGDAANLKNLVWISANIYDCGLPENSCDIAYARWMLVHLHRPIEAMRKV